MKKIILNTSVKCIKIICNYAPWLLTIILWKVKLLLRYVLRYRFKVIDSNIKLCFGKQLQQKDLYAIREKYYDVLIRYFKEIIYVISWPKQKLLQSIQLKDSDYWKKYLQSQRSTIITASHYGNWEMNIIMLPVLLDQRTIGFYKEISDNYIDQLMLSLRATFGVELYPIEQTARIMNKYKDVNILYIFIGDQSPFNMNGVYWNTFLGCHTPWLNGAEKISRKFNYPVVYLCQIPESSTTNLYSLKLQHISENPQSEESGQITEKYTRMLEEQINNKPEYWLWSHKRWKRANTI